MPDFLMLQPVVHIVTIVFLSDFRWGANQIMCHPVGPVAGKCDLHDAANLMHGKWSVFDTDSRIDMCTWFGRQLARAESGDVLQVPPLRMSSRA
jgi:hypothetical protein